MVIVSTIWHRSWFRPEAPHQNQTNMMALHYVMVLHYVVQLHCVDLLCACNAGVAERQGNADGLAEGAHRLPFGRRRHAAAVSNWCPWLSHSESSVV